VLSICGHSVPQFRREGWRACFDDSMEPLGHGAIRFPHLGDLREHGAFTVRLVRLQLLDAVLHRGSFLVRESLELLADRGTALGRLLRFSVWAHRNILKLTRFMWVRRRTPVSSAHDFSTQASGLHAQHPSALSGAGRLSHPLFPNRLSPRRMIGAEYEGKAPAARG